MAATTDDEDRLMNKRMAQLFRENPEFSRDYFANPPASDSSPVGKNNYARHQEAIAHVQNLLRQEEAKRGQGSYEPGASRVGVEREIRELMDSPSYGNTRHANHGATMDRLSYLYRSLNPPKEEGG